LTRTIPFTSSTKQNIEQGSEVAGDGWRVTGDGWRVTGGE
jgi:hypothetical protein